MIDLFENSLYCFDNSIGSVVKLIIEISLLSKQSQAGSFQSVQEQKRTNNQRRRAEVRYF
jgi:hypothetical protein